MVELSIYLISLILHIKITPTKKYYNTSGKENKLKLEAFLSILEDKSILSALSLLKFL